MTTSPTSQQVPEKGTPPGTQQTPTQAPLKNGNSDFRKIPLKIGDYELHPIPTGEFGLDGGAMFGTVPKVLWEKSNPPDEQNRIPMEARALLLKSSKHIILIDVGNGQDFEEKYGDKLGKKFAQIYAMKPDGNSLLKSLSHHGVTPDKVTHVILTHLHFDHAGGATCWRDNKVQAQFPNAKYYVQKGNFDHARTPNLRERASYFEVNYMPLKESGQLHLLEGEVEILPGISTLLSHGHTSYHQMIKISDGNTTLLYCGDVVPTSSHVRSAWIMGYDLEPLTIIDEKRKILEKAARENWFLFFEHDPYCNMATVEKVKDDYAVSERLVLT